MCSFSAVSKPKLSEDKRMFGKRTQRETHYDARKGAQDEITNGSIYNEKSRWKKDKPNRNFLKDERS